MRPYRKNTNWAVVITVFITVVVLVIAIFLNVRPILCTYAKNRSDDLLSAAANAGVGRALASGKYSYEQLAVLSRNSNNEINGIEINTVMINQLKLDVIRGIQQELKNKNRGKFSVPVGTLLPSKYTNGFGPRIHIPYEFTDTLSFTYDNQFVSVGINQSLHRIYITVQFHVCLITVGSTEYFTVSVTVPVAQTVIVGQVPESYTNIIDGSGEHVVDNIINFADRK